MNRPKKSLLTLAFAALLIFFMAPHQAEAQRMSHKASRGSMSRPSPQASRPSSQPSAKPSTRPSTRPSAPATSPSTANRGSINGGYQKTASRDVSRPSTGQADRSVQTSRPSTGQADRSVQTSRPSTSDRSTGTARDKASDVRTSDVTRPNSREVSTNRENSGNRVGNNSNNRVNVDKSRGDVNINIDNSRTINSNRRNTYVRSSPRTYYRPPYVWGGFHFYCHSPYYWHPYTPWYWGPSWHPWGFFVTTLATTAIIVSIVDDSGNKEDYHYDDGNYYIKTENGYEVVQAPVGATVNSIPESAQQVQVTENTYNYYYGGAYYEKGAEGYTVVPATAGTIVPHLPEGGEEVKVGDRTYVKFGETYYQPIQVDGKDMYEIVEVKPESE